MNSHNHKLPQAIVLSCIDFRFHEKLKQALKKKKISSYDLICLAGGAKNLASPSKKIYRQTVIDNIELSRKLHQVKMIVLCNHIDCGAYGGSNQFDDLNEEIKFHQTELKKAENMIKKLIPALKIKTIILK